MKQIKSMYSVTFNSSAKGWEKSRKYNVTFLRVQQYYANDLMRSRCVKTTDGRIVMRGYLYLNEVFDMLGIPRTKVGDIVGWVYDETDPIGDNYIDFEINPRGTNPNVVLDFNVDGDISDYIFV